ncbi:MAG: SHOCT domain-containing protein [Bacteroidales bacterium]|jgi:putative membrane protein|nr:SHOCT domain-containing protein [Bacteroidales bacterium]
MMNGYDGHGWGMGLGMGWWWIIGIIALALIIWLVVRATNQNSQTNLPGNKSSLDILKDRYARGEIDKAEFEERKKDLM